jgi:hypothetical protein
METIISRHEHQIADALARHGIDLPTALADAFAAYAAAQSYDLDAPEDVNTAVWNAAPAEIPAVIDRLTLAVAMRAARQQVRGDVLAACARRVIQQLRVSGPSLIEQAAGAWNNAAAAFTAAFRQLPTGNVTAERLIAAGSAAVQAHEACQAAAVVLDDLADARDTLATIHGIRAGGNPQLEHATRYATISNTLKAPSAARPAPHPSGRWAALLATPGVTELRWRTIADHSLYIRTIPKAELRAQSGTTNGFRGTRMVEVVVG